MITTHMDSNIDAVIKQVEAQMPKKPVQHASVENVAEYARHLHNRQGFSVINEAIFPAAAFESVDDQVGRMNAAGMLLTDAAHTEALKEATTNAIEWHQRVTGMKQSPGRFRAPPRPGHFQAWASDQGVLVNSWMSEVEGQREHHEHIE